MLLILVYSVTALLENHAVDPGNKGVWMAKVWIMKGFLY